MHWNKGEFSQTSIEVPLWSTSVWSAMTPDLTPLPQYESGHLNPRIENTTEE